MRTGIELVDRAKSRGEKTAILSMEGEYTYGQLLSDSALVAQRLLAHSPQGLNDLREVRVAFLAPRSYSYVAMQWGIWRAGGIAVPLCESHPPPELAYVIEDCGASLVIAHPAHEKTMRPLAAARDLKFLSTAELLDRANPEPRQSAGERVGLPEVDETRRAMIVYTSGTTSRPKGVVSTHDNIRSQIWALVKAWEWSESDHILNVLPLHHVHGIINVLSCALWAGATCQMLPKFDVDQVWRCIEEGEVNLFMAVPTVYAKLITAYEGYGAKRRASLVKACLRFRLMVSGSAALPVQTLEKWQTISGHVLLERYGMTEMGMALSNPLRGERRPGHVGTPLPGVEVQLVDEQGRPVPEGTQGEIWVMGPNVFTEYWNRPEATRQAFQGGWFRTGDVAVLEGGSYRIVGRESVDIIKSGGYKISALEVEAALRDHPAIEECAVVGVEDAEWGERVSAAVVLRRGSALTLEALRAWARDIMATYKIPSRLLVLTELPRNTLGKVTKPELKRMF
jgi:malonyl-CoA/methylmalonyl-CoA synthetase